MFVMRHEIYAWHVVKFNASEKLNLLLKLS